MDWIYVIFARPAFGQESTPLLLFLTHQKQITADTKENEWSQHPFFVGSAEMLIPKKNRIVIYECLFKHGVIVAKKDFNLMKHPELETVPNLQVIKALQVRSVICVVIYYIILAMITFSGWPLFLFFYIVYFE